MGGFSIRCLLLGHDDSMVERRKDSGCGAITAAARRQAGRSPQVARGARRNQHSHLLLIRRASRRFPNIESLLSDMPHQR